MKRYCLLLIIQFIIMLGLSGCSVQDTDIDNPLVGKTVETQSFLYILNVLENDKSFTNSPTALKLGNVSLTIDALTSCSGCGFRKLTLREFLPKKTTIKIVKAYRSNPPFFHIDSSSMDYFIMQTENGITFTMPSYEMDGVITTEKNFNTEEGQNRETLLNSFSNETEKKSFYFKVKDFYQKTLFPTKQPPFSSDDVKNTFPEVFANINQFNISDININTGQLAFSVTTDRKGLAYLILKTSEKFVDISPYQKMN